MQKIIFYGFVDDNDNDNLRLTDVPSSNHEKLRF